MASATTQIVSAATTANSGTDVDITWNPPASNGGSAIISYRVKILGKDSLIY